MNLNPKNIWLERQNKVTYVVRDLADYAPEDVVYESLLRRGVFKWLAVRRDLIKAKDLWKARIRQSLVDQKHAKHGHEVWYQRGYRRALEECRAEVRAMCHSQRWRAPDFDGHAWHWLNKQ
jgi:hypothetical protein